MFGKWSYSYLIESGNARPQPMLINNNIIIGAGNALVIGVYADMLVPVNDADVKWIDVYVSYRSDDAARKISADNDTVFTDGEYWPSDIISVRGDRFPGTQYLYHRWQIHRLPNPADPENVVPDIANTVIINEELTPHPDEVPIMTFPDRALGDYLVLRVKLIAVDQDVDAVLRDGEQIQIGVMPGGFARTT
jgi:hypothetical protein